MQVTDAEIIISAVSPKQYPTTGLPEFALAGRSNVGKSSFINKLIRRKALARTSSKPGKTQTLNYYLINKAFYFVDVPGYGYAKVSKTERAKWGEMLETYFTQRETLQHVFLMVDFRHPPTADDIQMKEFIEYYQIPYTVIATKADKIPRGKWNQHTSQTKKALGLKNDDALIIFSSESGEGKDKAWNVISQYLS
ncbi:ribosome biogenesis GTP-binding protein YihA/YsxC [Jeotgalibaca ciconiae]|uniref:Probable GTP-binding protein EngB n=1 Tax=Jeotgalibaca ciconiae TaxID=2496265 RepID=A0A3Q9BLT3_9LACT|nr:ribosome biogenesis GTP-binding protein YihA/YsxC [Jeotgalibaca ciconiae]AZP05325.1 YihA family ribosome biogenesis GTP-binding protein [Jeotgalibaca ciconiae]